MSKKLFVPGPIDVSEDVLEKMSTQVISHRGEDASKLQEDITKKLHLVIDGIKWVYQPVFQRTYLKLN